MTLARGNLKMSTVAVGDPPDHAPKTQMPWTSLHTLGPKLSKSRKGQQGASTRAPRSAPAPVCKTEPETEAASCGVEKGTSKGSNENIADEEPLDEDPPFRDNPNYLIDKPEAKKEKSRRRPTLKQKEDKKEKESEKEDEENEIKKEESPKMAVKMEVEMEMGDDEVGDDVEPPRKRGRRRKDEKLPKRRKKPPVQYVRCEMEGCGTILAHPRYLQHHIKYQHLLKKKYVCSHPSCGRLFRLQKQLLRHAKHHTDQRDFICEYCARAFKSSHNLAVHRMIHTGEKPIQCEICGFTCRQKASLNWHMKKHDADASYQFSCSICGKKFEKKDSVVAHKAKSHPEVLIAEALAANGGTVITSPAPVMEAVPELTSPAAQPSISQESQAMERSTPCERSIPWVERSPGGALAPLQQVVLPLAPQTQMVASQGQLLQLAPHHVAQVRQEQETSALLHLTAATTSAAYLSATCHPQLVQLTALPIATAVPMVTTDCQSTLLTLSSVTTLAPQQPVEWVREADEEVQLAGEGDLWERVIVDGDHQDVGEMVWEGDGERRKEDEGIVWEREGERQILLESAEVHGDRLI
ncbi:uncharacterized protein LOC139914437 [Centroberyx gerrardi]|uniref:uncharacterized protein n=1 Tax=Centroberyx gerrardi TaxID=166262 RepID=UPI003AB09B2F